MTVHSLVRIFSYGICLILNFIGILKFARYFDIGKNLAFVYPIIGTVFLFLVIHYLCIVRKAIKQDFSLLIGLSGAVMLLSVLYWVDRAVIIGVIFLAVIVILLFEYKHPDWLGKVREYLIKKKSLG